MHRSPSQLTAITQSAGKSRKPRLAPSWCFGSALSDPWFLCYLKRKKISFIFRRYWEAVLLLCYWWRSLTPRRSRACVKSSAKIISAEIFRFPFRPLPLISRRNKSQSPGNFFPWKSHVRPSLQPPCPLRLLKFCRTEVLGGTELEKSRHCHQLSSTFASYIFAIDSATSLYCSEKNKRKRRYNAEEGVTLCVIERKRATIVVVSQWDTRSFEQIWENKVRGLLQIEWFQSEARSKHELWNGDYWFQQLRCSVTKMLSKNDPLPLLLVALHTFKSNKYFINDNWKHCKKI